MVVVAAVVAVVAVVVVVVIVVLAVNCSMNTIEQFHFPCHILSYHDTFSFKISFTLLSLYNLCNFCSFLLN